MAIVRRSYKQIERSRGHVDHAKVAATSEADIQRHRREDGELYTIDPGRLVMSPIYIRRIRKRLNLTQTQFARRFGLRTRTVQEWEQGRAIPEGPARVLLRVIDRESAAVQRALAHR